MADPKAEAVVDVMSGLEKKLIEIEDGLISHGFLRNGGPMPPKKPRHGPCCTCQSCGYGDDECVCDSNSAWEWWQAIKEKR